MHASHKRFREEGRSREQRELARFLSGIPHRKLGYLLSDFEATLELDGPWEAAKVLIRSLPRFPLNQELRYRLHYLYLDAGMLGCAGYWLREALRVENSIKARPKASSRSRRRPRPPRLVRRDPPRTIHYFFYACPFTWGEEKWDEEEFL